MKKLLLVLCLISLVACSEKHPTCDLADAASPDSADASDSDSADMSQDVSAVDASEDSTKVD